MKKFIFIFLMGQIITILAQEVDVGKKLKELEETVETVKKIKAEYESKIAQLEKQIKELKEKLEEKEIEQEAIAREFEKEKKESQRFRQQIGRVSYLPDISVIGDFRFRGGSNILDEKFFVNEIELAFSGAVDPYFISYDAFITLERSETGEMEIDAEESYVTYKGIKNLGIRIGRFLIPITKSNTWHTHQRLFGEVPLYYNEYFNGSEGFKTEGIHFYYQIYNPNVEVSFYLLNNRNSAIFMNDSSNLLPVLSVKKFFAFTYTSDLEATTSIAYGANQFDGNTLLLANTLIYRWKNTSAPYNRINILTENIFAKVGNAPIQENKYSNYTLLYYNFSKYVAGGVDFNIVKSIDSDIYKTAYGIIFDIIPSEFSFLRFNYHHRPQTNENIFLIELNFGIGKHRAHTY